MYAKHHTNTYTLIHFYTNTQAHTQTHKTRSYINTYAHKIKYEMVLFDGRRTSEYKSRGKTNY